MSSISAIDIFRFKKFDIIQDNVPMKVNTDGILLGAWSNLDNAGNALDIGTGTGIIAMMISQRFSSVKVTGIDVDKDSLAVANINFDNCPFKARLNAECVSVQDYTHTYHGKFDKIISNPPFFSGGTFSSNENRSNVRHTVKLSHADLLGSVQKLLSPHGSFDVILPYIEGLRFVELAKQYDLNLMRMSEVRPRPSKPIERLLISLTNQHNVESQKEHFVVYADDYGNEYSLDFKRLTHEFYLFMNETDLD
jgi:tRNA1Val (adenine37-N6)-methyltransferase